MIVSYTLIQTLLAELLLSKNIFNESTLDDNASNPNYNPNNFPNCRCAFHNVFLLSIESFSVDRMIGLTDRFLYVLLIFVAVSPHVWWDGSYVCYG